MSEGEVRAAKSVAKKSRRRKKRRTVDVSDSSDSDSSSGSESGKESKTVEVVVEEDEDIALTDDEAVVKEVDAKTDVIETLDNATQAKLKAIPFTTTELTERVDYNKGQSADLTKVKQKLQDDRHKLDAALTSQGEDKTSAEIKNKYLGLMFENYGEDINSLREAPDFTNKSLVMLANVLKDGTGMFDVDTLKTVLN